MSVWDLEGEWELTAGARPGLWVCKRSRAWARLAEVGRVGS